MRFLGNVLSTIVGLFVFFGILFFGTILIVAAIGSSTDTVAIKDNSVITLDLSDVKYDYAGKYNYKDMNFKDSGSDGVADILAALDAAQTDERIKGISILNNSSSLGIVQMREIRQKLDDFKKSGKFVVAYANTYSQREYYLNSVADTVYLNPVGDLTFQGLSSEILYLKGLQEKTGVHMEVIRHGKFKSAVEPFLEDHMSEANREQITEYISSIWQTITTDISASRKVSVDSLNAIAENLSARTPKMALDKKLVDKIAYEDEYQAGIRKALGVAQDKEYNTVSILDYTKDFRLQEKTAGKKDQIAVIYAQGQILNGEGSVSHIGEGSINRALRKARLNDKVKAIVFRVNSPGGSALTSELIWREIELTKKVKPVIVSMGDYAASGGYYIACNADRIFADPATLTGSIGVYGMLPNFKELANKYGVNSEVVSTHTNASGYSPFRSMDPKYREVMTESTENIYEVFVNRVAAGRNMTFEQVNAIGQGRVWTGADAVKNGLVDELGNLDNAIAYAAKKVEITDYKLVSYPEYEVTFRDMINMYFGSSMMQTQDELLKEKIGEESFEMIEKLNYFNRMKGAQAIIPYEISIY